MPDPSIFADDARRRAVTPSGESTRTSRRFGDAGASSRSAWEILTGSVNPGPLMGFDLLSRPARTFGELGMETITHLGNLDEPQPVTQGLQLGRATTNPAEAQPGGTGETASILSGRGAGAPEVQEQISDPNRDERMGLNDDDLTPPPDVQATLNEAERLRQQGEQLAELEASGTLTEQSQFLVNQLRQQNAEALEQVELDLMKAQQQLTVQDALFEFQADQLGLDLDLDPLAQAINQEGSVGAQTLLAIKDIANNAAMSVAEKSDAVDLVMQRGHFSDALIEAVDEMVANRTDLEKLQKMSDVELAAHGGVANFFSPTFENAVIVDEVERHGEIFDQTIFNSPMGDVVTGMDDTQFKLYDNTVSAVMANGVDSPEAMPLIAALAQATGEDIATWKRTLDAGAKRVEASRIAFERANDNPDKLTPGSEEMVYAIIGAGRNLVPDDILNLIANSAELHSMIKVKSNGAAGGAREGTIRGVGGLTEEMYEKIMGEPWTPDKGMEWELQALLVYIMRMFNGDPIEAVNFYRTTGEWGGVQSLGGGENLEQPDLRSPSGA